MSRKIIAIFMIFTMSLTLVNINVYAESNQDTEECNFEIDKVISIPYDAFEYNEHFYYVYDTDSDWNQAKEYCKSLGGYMATLTSKEESDAVYEYIKSKGYESAYFGFSDEETEGVWKWVNDEEVTYTNWNIGEPNNKDSIENYAMFYDKFTDGTWNDGDFTNDVGKKSFICEWNTQESTYVVDVLNEVTEEMLFTTNYAKYLKNESYDHMISTLCQDMNDIVSSSQYNQSSELKTALKSVFSVGVIGQLEYILKSMTSAIKGNDILEEEAESAVVLDYIRKIQYKDEEGNKWNELKQGTSDTVKARDYMKTIMDGGESIYEWIEDDKDLRQFIEFINKDFFNMNELEIEEQFIELLKNKAELQQWGRVLQETKRSMSTIEIITSVVMLKSMSEEMLQYYMSLLDQGSTTYKGLEINYKKIKDKDIITFGKEFMKQEGAGEILDLTLDATLSAAGVESASPIIAVTEIVYMFGGLYLENQEVIGVEDWLKVQTALRDEMWISNAVSEQYLRALKNNLGKDSIETQEIKNDYKTLFNLYIACILQASEYIEEFSKKDVHYRKLQEDLERYESKLNYESYINSCLSEANEIKE